MSEVEQAAAPAETQTSAQTPAPAPEQPRDPNWLPARLERERKAILKELGVEDIKDAKTALDELKKRQDSERTEYERLKLENDALKATAAKAAEYQAALKLRAESELAALSDEQREALLSLTGDDPAKQITAIEKMRAVFLKPAATAPTPATTATSAPAPKPADTAPAKSHLAEYERLKTINPMVAASYRLANLPAILNEQKDRA